MYLNHWHSHTDTILDNTLIWPIGQETVNSFNAAYVSETQAFGSRAGRYQIFQLLQIYLYPVYRKLLSYDLGYGLYKGHYHGM
jgi:hypothetical protein